MSAVMNYKYTDEQVAADWALFRSLASDYVANYKGHFELLVSYRERVRAGYNLTVPMVRATMNCMLRDAHVIDIPEPAGPAGNVVPFRPRSFKDFRAIRQHQASYPYDDWRNDGDDEEEIVQIERPRHVEMSLKFKHDYGIVLHRMANVVHRVHPDSYARWDTETNTGTPVIWWRCKGHRGAYKMGNNEIIIMSSLEAAIHIMQSGQQFRLCLRCRELADAQQVLVEEVLSLVDYRQVGTADMRPLPARYPRS